MAARKATATKSKRSTGLRAQMDKYNQAEGEDYTFPVCGITIKIKPVGVHLTLLGGVLPDAFEMEKFEEAVTSGTDGNAETNINATHLFTVTRVMVAVCREAFRQGCGNDPEEMELFESELLPILTKPDLEDLFSHIQQMGSAAEADVFPVAATAEPT